MPADDTRRLVYADYLDDLPRTELDQLASVRAEIQDFMDFHTGRCKGCDLDVGTYGTHNADCAIRQLWCTETQLRAEPGLRSQDRDVATAQFIRLTCGSPSAKLPEHARRCPNCQGEKGGLWICPRATAPAGCDTPDRATDSCRSPPPTGSRPTGAGSCPS